MIKSFKKGFTVIELLAVMAIMALLTGIALNSFSNFRSNQALVKDTETVVAVLRQARSQTLASKNFSVYGVHFATTTATVFTGGTYNSSTTTNQTFALNSSDNILTITLAGGGSDVTFARLSGETTQNGTIVISSTRLSISKTVTIYKTGLVEAQ